MTGTTMQLKGKCFPMRHINSRSKRVSAGIAATAVLAVGLTACTSDSESADSGSSSSSSSSSSSASAEPTAPAPVAPIDALTGKNTAIALDTGFTDALTSLELTRV